MSASTAPVPETMEGLRKQNSAYRALCAAMEATQAIHTQQGRKYQEAITTLDSEREANALLTAEIERLRAALERQTENVAWLLNRVTLPDQWYAKFSRELEEDRRRPSQASEG